ncbi:MAG: zinc-dependent peptidase [Phycisphaerales bacterium]
MLRRYRRKSALSAAPTLAESRTLASNLAFWSRLTDAERDRLVKFARIIIREKNWEGCAGLELTDEIRLVIAAQAALLLLGQDLDPLTDAVFPNVRTVLVYPSGFVAPTARQGPGGVMTEGHSNLGEAHYMGQSGGPIIVSWRHAHAGGLDGSDGRNLVLHEFAHKLDFLDGVVDGTPPLRSKDEYERWKRVMSAHFNDLVRRAAAGAPSLIDHYGATNPAEFFAVATEAFFERGAEMREHLPELYGVLRSYYGWETA